MGEWKEIACQKRTDAGGSHQTNAEWCGERVEQSERGVEEGVLGVRVKE